MDKNKLTEFLKRLKSALHKRRLDRKLLDDLQFEWFLIDKEIIDLSTAYGMLSTINKDLDEERSKELEWYFLRLMSKSIHKRDNYRCPYFLQKENSDIKLPFKTWEEEIRAVCSDYNSDFESEYDFEILYFQRCCRCKEIDCPYRIIHPEKDGPYWRKSEYNQKYPQHQESSHIEETPQQKAARTKTEEAEDAIEEDLHALCEKLIEYNDNNFVKRTDGGIYKFNGSARLYAYLAVQISDNNGLTRVPWKVFKKHLNTSFCNKSLGVAKQKIKDKRPRGGSKIDSCMAEI